MGYEISIPVGMLFRKMYCLQCGTRLKRQKRSKTYTKDEFGYKRFVNAGRRTMINFGTYTRIYYMYHCPKCDTLISYRKQLTLVKETRKKKESPKALDE